MKKLIKRFIILIILCVIVIVVFSYCYFKKKNKVELRVNDLPNITISNSVVDDEEKPNEITKVDISTDNKVLSAISIGEFSNGQDLTDEQYLQVAYYAINNGLIDANKKEFSVKEVNSIIYSIFNRELNENISIEDFVYDNDKYLFREGEKSTKVLKIIEKGTAAGSNFTIFEIDGISYIAKIATNTVTGENYIQSIIKE